MFTEKQSEALDRIIKGDSITDIAKDIGISRPTMYSWMKSEEWTAEMESRLEASAQAVKSRIQSLLTSQVDMYIMNVWDIASDKNNAPTVRLQATQYAMKLMDSIAKDDVNAALKEPIKNKDLKHDLFTGLKAVGE